MTATELEVDLPADLVERAMLLTTAGKQKLAGLLLKAVELPPDDPEVVRQEWNAVIADRLEGFLSGKYKTVDAEESIRRVREEFLKDHPQ